ncbi:MAG: hypothetical protein ACTSW4_05620 [Candidatus Ranarchaeia archaeon]
MNRFEHKFYAALSYIVIFFFTTNIYEGLRIAFWPSLLMVILGGHFPDFDLDFGIKFHRSPITHSPLISWIIFIGYLFTPSPPWVVEIMAWVIVGYATHLFFDLAPSGWGLIGLLISAFNPAHAPGDIRHVSERLERPFLILGGINCTLIAIVLFLVIRNVIVLPFLPIHGLS